MEFPESQAHRARGVCESVDAMLWLNAVRQGAPVAGVASGDSHAYVDHLTATAGVGGVAIAGWELSSSTATAVSSS
jgi:hypothetical protein